MFGTGPGNSIGPLGAGAADEPFGFAGVAPEADAAAGNRPAACASAAFTSAEFMRTSLGPCPAGLGFSSWFSFSWNDCAAAGGNGAATGEGLRSTSTSVKIEIAKVAKLMTRCTFRRHLHLHHGKPGWRTLLR